MQVFLSVVIGIVSGIISSIISAILIRGYYKLKTPKIEISDRIAKNKSDEYRIKIVNKSPFYVTNIQVQARLVTIKNGMGGNVVDVKKLDVPTAQVMLIDPYSPKNDNKTYAIWVGISKMLDQLWVDDSCTHLKVTVYCSTEWNVSKVFERCYHKKHVCVKEGEFVCGSDMNIYE